MTIQELKSNILTKSDYLLNDWFDQNTLSDNIFKGIGKTIIQSNINKYDNVINLFADENGDLNIDMLIENIISQFPDKFEIDIQKMIGIPFNKILLISRQDIVNLLK